MCSTRIALFLIQTSSSRSLSGCLAKLMSIWPSSTIVGLGTKTLMDMGNFYYMILAQMPVRCLCIMPYREVADLIG